MNRARRVVALAFLAVFAAVVVAACGGPAATATSVATEEPSEDASLDPSPESSESPIVIVPDSPVAGIVSDIDSAGLTDVRGFTLRSSSGDTLEFVIGTLENGDEFPPGHLVEHQAAAAPILVFFREENGQLVVFRLEDAG